jgi:transketolase
MSTQRDVFISTLYEQAKKDKDIYLISVDMGAAALDEWREKLPGQFFAAGISEQHAMNFAAGLAARGKKPYVYFMACWVARCFEQIRYSGAMAKNPITILGNGVALGYAPAGPGHEPTEDIAYMRSLCGIEIDSPANILVAKQLAKLSYTEPKLRYIRLERSYPKELETLYPEASITPAFLESGMATVRKGKASSGKPKIGILSSGYLLGRAVQAHDKLSTAGHDVSVVDLWKIKPVDPMLFLKTVQEYDFLVTIEEQTLSGGFGSAVAELLTDLRCNKQMLRLGLPERYLFENGTREQLLDKNGLSVDTICSRIVDGVASVSLKS